MERLLKFIYEYRAFFTFLFLEFLCAWMIVENNQYQSSAYFNSSNAVVANVLGFSQGVKEYFSLRTINQQLADENAALREQLELQNGQYNKMVVRDSSDSLPIRKFTFLSAKVYSNSTEFYKNYITIDKGKEDGVLPGMAVITQAGAVGKVKAVSEHFAVVVSLLNIDEMVSATIKRTDNFGTIQWDGLDMRLINLRYIPRHATPMVGDTIITSGYNSIFPEGIIIGTIKTSELTEEANFWNIKVQLAQDFNSLAFVEIVDSKLKSEFDSLQVNAGIK